MTLQDGQDGVPTNRIYENEGLSVATGECREASAHDGARWILINDSRGEKIEVLAALSVPMALQLATQLLNAIQRELNREDAPADPDGQ